MAPHTIGVWINSKMMKKERAIRNFAYISRITCSVFPNVITSSHGKIAGTLVR